MIPGLAKIVNMVPELRIGVGSAVQQLTATGFGDPLINGVWVKQDSLHNGRAWYLGAGYAANAGLFYKGEASGYVIATEFDGLPETIWYSNGGTDPSAVSWVLVNGIGAAGRFDWVDH